MESTARRERGRLREALGDRARALEDFERALTLARSTNDPQELLPNMGAAVAALEDRGRADDAQTLARELVDLARAYPHDAVWAVTMDFLVTRAALEHERELRDALESTPPWPWKELAFACLDRDFVRAADMWAEAGSPTWEARLRMRAAEELIENGRHAEGEAELQKALAFYRTVGATFYLDRGEVLLAKTA
jgi:tetratricopeptide (TPR) repeat protein